MAARTFVDGPAHEQCLVAATRLCPYLSRKTSRRSAAAQDSVEPTGFDPAKPHKFLIGVTRSYKTIVQSSGIVLHRAAPFVRFRQFTYQDGVLTEDASTDP